MRGMPTIPELLDRHVTLEVECLDRLYRNGYIGKLVTGTGLVFFMREQLEKPIPSPVVLGQISEKFREVVKALAEFGPLFVKVCSYAPWSIRLCLNGHEWAKRQLDKRVLAMRLWTMASCPASSRRSCRRSAIRWGWRILTAFSANGSAAFRYR